MSWSCLSYLRNGTPIFALLFGKKCNILLQMGTFLQPMVRSRAQSRANCGSVGFVCSENAEKCPRKSYGTPFWGAFGKKSDLYTFKTF